MKLKDTLKLLTETEEYKKRGRKPKQPVGEEYPTGYDVTFTDKGVRLNPTKQSGAMVGWGTNISRQEIINISKKVLKHYGIKLED